MVNKYYQKTKKSFEKKNLKCTKISLKMKTDEKMLGAETKISLIMKKEKKVEDMRNHYLPHTK